MSAIVCGKRSYFDDLPNSPSSVSPPVSKRLRFHTSTSPFRSSPSPPRPSAVDQLRALFPNMDNQVYKFSIGAGWLCTLMATGSNNIIMTNVKAECRIWQNQGVNIKYENRANKNGYKAGALQEGLQKHVNDCEYVVIFDADFLKKLFLVSGQMDVWYLDQASRMFDIPLQFSSWHPTCVSNDLFIGFFTMVWKNGNKHTWGAQYSGELYAASRQTNLLMKVTTSARGRNLKYRSRSLMVILAGYLQHPSYQQLSLFTLLPSFLA